MRKLTQNEIDQAPSWATNYFIYTDGQEIRWQDNIGHNFMWSHEGVKFPFPRDDYNRGESINRKPFDISEYEFEDGDIERVAVEDGNVVALYNFELNTAITKRDTIALAKHFKLTADDLK